MNNAGTQGPRLVGWGLFAALAFLRQALFREVVALSSWKLLVSHSDLYRPRLRPSGERAQQSLAGAWAGEGLGC